MFRLQRAPGQVAHREGLPWEGRPEKHNLSVTIPSTRLIITKYLVIDDLDHEAAAGAYTDILTVSQVTEGDLESVAARAGVVVELQRFVIRHVFDFDLIVVRFGHDE